MGLYGSCLRVDYKTSSPERCGLLDGAAVAFQGGRGRPFFRGFLASNPYAASVRSYQFVQTLRRPTRCGTENLWAALANNPTAVTAAAHPLARLMRT